MDLFLELEIVYIVIGIFILSVTAFVTSRDFVPKGAFKKGMSFVGLFVAIMIGLHYYATTSRMTNVEAMFEKGNTIICENKMLIMREIFIHLDVLSLQKVLQKSKKIKMRDSNLKLKKKNRC